MPVSEEGSSKNIAFIGAVAGLVALGVIAVVTQQMPMIVKAFKALGPVYETIFESYAFQYTMWVVGFLFNFALGWIWSTKTRTKAYMGNSLVSEKRKSRGLKIELNGQNRKVDSLLSKAQTLQTAVEKEQKLVTKYTLRVKELETSKQHLLEEIKTREAAKIKLENEMADLTESNADTTRQLEDLRRESRAFREEYVSLKDEFKDFARVNQAQVVTIAKQTAQVKELKAALETAQLNEAGLSKDMAELVDENSMLHTRRQSMEEELEQAARALSALKAEAAGTAAEAAAMRKKHAAAEAKLLDYAEAQSALELAQHKLGLIYGDMCSYSNQALESFDRKELIEIKAYAKFKERGFTQSKEEEILDYETSENEVEALEKKGASQADLLVLMCKVAAKLLNEGDYGFFREDTQARSILAHTLGAVSFVEPAGAKNNAVSMPRGDAEAVGDLLESLEGDEKPPAKL